MAENIKEFFHNNGIHSTTIQPEFVDCNGFIEGRRQSGTGTGSEAADECALSCPKDPEKMEPNCQASKCCPNTNGGAGSRGSKSEQNTPKTSRRRRNSLGFNYTTSTSNDDGEVQILMPPPAYPGSNPEITSSSSTRG